MEWITTHATEWKNGNIDRKAECDKYCNSERLQVLKSSMIGGTYYAAVKSKATSEVFGVVMLTSINTTDDYFDFSYKPMDETMEPYSYDCPASILNLLTPTKNERALRWRAICRENLNIKKQKSVLSKADCGTKIKFIFEWKNGKHYEQGEVVTLVKSLLCGKKVWLDLKKYTKWTNSHIPTNFEIV